MLPPPRQHPFIAPSCGTLLDAGDLLPQSPGTLSAPDCSIGLRERSDRQSLVDMSPNFPVALAGFMDDLVYGPVWRGGWEEHGGQWMTPWSPDADRHGHKHDTRAK